MSKDAADSGLDDSDDLVRFEVQAALERGVRVIPVLVDGAKPLRQEQLPAELNKLARLNALELSYGRYEYDADRLLNLIQRVIVTTPDSIAPESLSEANAEALTATHNVRPDGTAFGEAAQQDPEVDRKDQGRTTRLLIDAKRTAESITDEPRKARALADVAGALAATDPDRAARLIVDAEHIAQAITHEPWKARALADVAGALAATDPDRAARLIADAEHIALDITDEPWASTALPDVARALAATDPDRAERIAQANWLRVLSK